MKFRRSRGNSLRNDKAGHKNLVLSKGTVKGLKKESSRVRRKPTAIHHQLVSSEVKYQLNDQIAYSS